MKKIGRPRKAVTKKNISVNLPSHVIDRINDQISWKASRSVWIENAIINRLDSIKPSLEEYPLNTLLFEAIQREEIEPHLRFAIKNYLDSTITMPVEETEATQ